MPDAAANVQSPATESRIAPALPAAPAGTAACQILQPDEAASFDAWIDQGTAETGVVLSFRYKLDLTATYEYDEYTRMLVQVDGVQYGRGAKDYVDHIGGDGSSSYGNSSSYLPTTEKEADSKALALKWALVEGLYAPDYPAPAYNYRTNTDDTPFRSYVASVSVRENLRSLTSTSGSSAEWINPYYHTTSDIKSSDTRDDDGKRDDIELGYNAARTTLGLVAELAGAHAAISNNAPVADAQSVTTDANTSMAITLSGTDADDDPLTYAVVSGPAASLQLSAINYKLTPFLG